MKFYRFICCLLASLMILHTAITGVFAQVDDTTVVTESSYSFDAAVAYLGNQQLVENVSAAFLYELNTNSLMYAWNPDQQISPSSLVKIMTTLLAVEKGSLTSVVTAEAEVLETVPFDAVSVELMPGEQMLLSDLLYCLMVGSANDAAAVIAHHISGSQDAFVEEMNARAESLGCTNTNFTNPHGLHDDLQYTTVRDMARILGAAVQNEDFMKFFSEVNYLVPATNMTNEARNLASSNFLRNNSGMEIYYDARVTGGRTGTANDGTRCLASSAEQNGMNLICIVSGCESAFSENGNTTVYGSFLESIALFDAGFNGYKSARVLYEGQALKQLPVVNGSSDVVLSSQSSVLTILPDGVTASDLSYIYRPYYEELRAPIQTGERLTQLQIWYKNQCVVTTDLYALNGVGANDDIMVADSDEGGSSVWLWVIGVIIGVPILIGFILLLLRLWFGIRRSVQKKRNNQHRRDRRRSK